ncbi:transposase [Bathymodiolus platifrons methanotrophic gill symbiont]|uniref:IS1634 family transposase n=1 Tax=Bathymodiolus platifrons methanotrophic gill symbiont TaxID=113268 RepID=UPI0021E12E2A|nr:transposase [Bathymodiolus platifrons methanotrophic gill symbiont]
MTNTFFEGEAKTNPKAQRGRSKEKRSDCPLVTLGLVLDGSGFPRKSQIFPGNASEPQTLQIMLEGLEERTGSTVILDAGIASEENIQYLIEHGYKYIVVSRKRNRDFDEEKATLIKDIPGQSVKVQKVTVEETGEVELYCHSQLREKKEQAMQDSFSEKYETALNSLHAGLSKKGTTKNYAKVLERLGRIKEKYARAAQHYEVTVVPDDEGYKAIGSVAKNKITLLSTIIRFNFSQRRFACSTKNGAIFQVIILLNTTFYLALTLYYRNFNDGLRRFFPAWCFIHLSHKNRL